MFDPNPKSIQLAIDSLLGVQPGGGKRTIEDALLIVSDYKHGYSVGENGYIFWDAVYSALQALYKEGRRN